MGISQCFNLPTIEGTCNFSFVKIIINLGSFVPFGLIRHPVSKLSANRFYSTLFKFLVYLDNIIFGFLIVSGNYRVFTPIIILFLFRFTIALKKSVRIYDLSK